MTIGERIKKIRVFRKMTMDELGGALGFEGKNMSVRISQYETGARIPGEDMILKLADALHCNYKASGKLSDERFVKLSQGYEAEQKDLQSEIEALRMELSQEKQQSVNVKSFLSTVKKYTEIPELTSEIVHEFIDRIIVHEADKSSGKRIQEIEIIYNHIGVFDRSKVNVYMGKAV